MKNKIKLVITIFLLVLVLFFFGYHEVPKEFILWKDLDLEYFNISLNEKLIWAGFLSINQQQESLNNSLLDVFEDNFFISSDLSRQESRAVLYFIEEESISKKAPLITVEEFKEYLNQTLIPLLESYDGVPAEQIYLETLLSTYETIKDYIFYPNMDLLWNDFQTINQTYNNQTLTQVNNILTTKEFDQLIINAYEEIINTNGLPLFFMKEVRKLLINYSTKLNKLNNEIIISNTTINQSLIKMKELFINKGFNNQELFNIINEYFPKVSLELNYYLTCEINNILYEENNSCSIKVPLLINQGINSAIIYSIPNPLNSWLKRVSEDEPATEGSILYEQANFFKKTTFYLKAVNYTIIIAKGVNEQWLNCSECINQTINQVTVYCNPELNFKNKELSVNISDWYYCNNSGFFAEEENEYVRQELLKYQTKTINLTRPINILLTKDYSKVIYCNDMCYKLTINSTIMQPKNELINYFINSIDQLT